MDDIRRLFAEANGVDAGWFSFNSKGACPVCKGTGQITYDMAFAEPVVVVCEECGGHRYNPTALSYCYRGKNIEDVMTLTIEQAMDFFDDVKIRRKLQVMMDVGLGYLTLGQPTSTLSGGEIQPQADWIIDMGPDGGTSGGEVVFQGTPQELIHCEHSKTGQYLKEACCTQFSK